MWKTHRVPRQTLLALAALLLAHAGRAHAFDTGPHTDLTRAALVDEGFNAASDVIPMAQVSNWLVDYYSTRPELGDPQLIFMAARLKHFHFDSLTTPVQIRNVWSRLALNTRSALQAEVAGVRSARTPAERYRRLVGLAVILGASLHPLQDFYSHSNWVDLYPMQDGAYGTRTWFDTPSPPASLHTGLVAGGDLLPTGDPTRDHGGYRSGMNRDSYSRPGWPQAYVYAYSASRQWLRAARQWVEQVDSTVWQDLLRFQLTPADRRLVMDDLYASYVISLWVAVDGKNGAWKGWGSGDTKAFGRYGLGWATLAATSPVVASFRGENKYMLLTDEMDRRNTDPGPPPAMPRVELRRRAVEVRTYRAAVLSGTPDGILNESDLYARVTIGGQQYVEATQQGADDIQPKWLSLGLVPDTATVIPIRYELFDEDDIGETPDIIDVGAPGGRTHAQFQIEVRDRRLSGDLSEVHDTASNPAALLGGGGDRYRGFVLLSVTVRELETLPAPPVP
ncbi:MAG TPA: hypothetical protein VHG93_23880 [Longimicrobium sp.]|nr:hypothetical protein [Longimicrobium sp.]